MARKDYTPEQAIGVLRVARRTVFTSRSDGDLVVADFSLISVPSS